MNDKELHEKVIEYMAENMGMQNWHDDQEQNWICGHLFAFASALLTVREPAPSNDVSREELLKALRAASEHLRVACPNTAEEAVEEVAYAFRLLVRLLSAAAPSDEQARREEDTDDLPDCRDGHHQPWCRKARQP